MTLPTTVTTAVESELVSPQKPKSNRKRSSKKQQQQRRPRKNSDGDLSVDTCGTASLSDDNSSTGSPAPTRRRRNRKSKKGKKQQQQQQQPELSEDEKAQYIAMDCEMVGVGRNGTQSALARVVLVNWDGDVILDEHIKPSQEITDYRTFVSGICAEDLLHASSFETVRQLVLEALEDKVLVGHALKNDLHALHLSHPWQQTRDTGKYEPFMKVRFDDGVFWPRKLRDLCAEKLEKEIQLPGEPHSPHEDAFSALQLYQKVRTKWEKVMDYKIKKTASIQKESSQ